MHHWTILGYTTQDCEAYCVHCAGEPKKSDRPVFAGNNEDAKELSCNECGITLEDVEP